MRRKEEHLGHVFPNNFSKNGDKRKQINSQNDDENWKLVLKLLLQTADNMLTVLGPVVQKAVSNKIVVCAVTE